MVTTMLGTPLPERRRALLHGIEGLRAQFGIDRVDVVLVSHYHDDHVCGIPVLQRLFNTQCWAAENFAHILEEPEGSAFPCTWPEPIRVDRRLGFDHTVRWEEYEFRLAPMHGHTRFSALIGFEADGKRFAHTGDQYFFYGAHGSMDMSGMDFAKCRRLPNHVYRNGAFLDSFDQSGRWVLDWRPDIVLQGHQPAFFTDEHFFHHIEEWSREYKSLHQRAMPLGDSDTHFNLDSWGGWIWPYRVHLRQPAATTVRVTVRNPFPRRAKLEVRLVGPTGWRGTCATLTAEPRAEVGCDLQIAPGGLCRRQPFVVELIADGQPFGQVAEALMTVGECEF
jgi:glyoxylase-like metal-dependent hydrolase (beta-lactamase superfamily II)